VRVAPTVGTPRTVRRSREVSHIGCH